MAENQKTGSSTCRAEFSPETKISLAADAGHTCSYELCLEPTTMAVTKKKKDGTPTDQLRPGGIGVAAHIYGATQTGCPRPSNKTPDELSDITNGIWVCHSHGTLIDQHEKAYTAEYLMLCEKVRTFAHTFSMTSADIRSVLKLVPRRTYEKIIWKYSSDLISSTKEIERDVMAEAGRQLSLDTLTSYSQIPSPPPKFKQTSLSIFASDDAKTPSTVNVETSKKASNSTIAELIKSWTRDEELITDKNISIIIEDLYAVISAKNSNTGIIAAERVSVSGRMFITVIQASDLTGMPHYHAFAWMRGSSPVAFNWNLVFGAKGESTSTIKRNKDYAKLITYSDSSIRDARQAEALLAKLVEGWKPIGFFGLHNLNFKRETFQNSYFEIDQIPNLDILKKMHRNAVRTLYPLTILDKFGHLFDVSDAFYDENLTEDMIDTAFEELNIASEGDTLPSKFCSKPCVETDTWTLCLIFRTYINGFFLGFKRIPKNSRFDFY